VPFLVSNENGFTDPIGDPWIREGERPAGTLIQFTIESYKRMAGSGAGDKLGPDKVSGIWRNRLPHQCSVFLPQRFSPKCTNSRAASRPGQTTNNDGLPYGTISEAGIPSR
jgi:hypothetical protein